MSLTDLQVTELFMKRFNCACTRILNSGMNLNYQPATNNIVAGLMIPYMGKHRRARSSDRWQLDPNATSIHPLALMLAGHRIYWCGVAADLSRAMGRSQSRYPIEPFMHGFVNKRECVDVWGRYKEDAMMQFCSDFFNLGRAFLYRFVGIYLNFSLRKDINVMFSTLK